MKKSEFIELIEKRDYFKNKLDGLYYKHLEDKSLSIIEIGYNLGCVNNFLFDYSTIREVLPKDLGIKLYNGTDILIP